MLDLEALAAHGVAAVLSEANDTPIDSSVGKVTVLSMVLDNDAALDTDPDRKWGGWAIRLTATSDLRRVHKMLTSLTDVIGKELEQSIADMVATTPITPVSKKPPTL